MGWIIALISVAVLGVCGWIGMSYIFREHKEIRSLPLNLVDFNQLKDGVYTGEYEGGMYKWRQNTVEVTVSDSKVRRNYADRRIHGEQDAANRDALYGRVIEQQSCRSRSAGPSSAAHADVEGILQAVEKRLLLGRG